MLTLRSNRAGLVWSCLSALLMLFASAEARAQATVTWQIGDQYVMTVYSGANTAATFTAAPQLTFPGQPAGNSAIFEFWWVETGDRNDPYMVTTDMIVDVPDGYTRAIAHYRESSSGSSPPTPPGVGLRMFDLVSGAWISSPTNILVDSTTPALFESKCNTVPCFFFVTDQASGDDITSVTAMSNTTVGVGETRAFEKWVTLSGAEQTSRTLQIPSTGMHAVAFYGEATLAPPRGRPLDLDLLSDLGMIQIPRICLYVSGISGCPGCDPNMLCGFDFVDIWGYELALVDEGDQVLAKGEEIRPGVMRLQLTPELVKRAGGMDKIGLRFRPIAERASGFQVRAKALHTGRE